MGDVNSIQGVWEAVDMEGNVRLFSAWSEADARSQANDWANYCLRYFRRVS